MGQADTNGYITKFVDNIKNSVNTVFIPGNVFTIYGSNIKIAGNSSDIGVFFVPEEDPSKAVKVKNLIENFTAKVMGIAPDTGYRYNKIEIRTQYTTSHYYISKSIRVIRSEFVLERVGLLNSD